MIDSRQLSLSEGTTSSNPPCPWARIDTASCTCRLTVVFHEAGDEKPSSEVNKAGKSGRVTLCSSTIFTSSPFNTATLTNLPKPSTRRCLITNNPGSTTSNTKQKPGISCVVPHMYISSSSCHTPRWMPERSTAGASLINASGVSDRRCSNIKGFLVLSGGRNANDILGERPSSFRRLVQKAV